MAQAKTQTSKKAETQNVGSFLDLVLENQEQLNKALINARKRGTDIAEKVSDQIYQGQREALELTKAVVSDPSSYSDNTKQMIDTATKAQTRTLDFAKELYNEQVAAAEALRESVQQIFEGSKEASEMVVEMGRSLSARNPLADAWQKGIDSFRSN